MLIEPAFQKEFLNYLNENLADSYGSAAVAQALLHRFARSDNRHSTRALLEGKSFVFHAIWSHHGGLLKKVASFTLPILAHEPCTEAG